MAMAAVLAALVSVTLTTPMAQAPPACATWQTCREATEQALLDSRYEDAHDLAWRAVQRGPKDDPALLTLLARTQALSGRTDDALVMVRRLTDRGVFVAARTDEAFARLRARAAWADLEARLTDLEQRLAVAPSTAPVAVPGPSRATAAEATTLRRAGSTDVASGARPRDAVTTAGARASTAPTSPAASRAPAARRTASSRSAPAVSVPAAASSADEAVRAARASSAVRVTASPADVPAPSATPPAPGTTAPADTAETTTPSSGAPSLADARTTRASAPARRAAGRTAPTDPAVDSAARPPAAPSRSASTAAAAATAVVDVRDATVEERVRLSGPAFHPSALVYDAVSARLLLADRDGRKIRVLGDGFDAPVDLVRAESAGFGTITAVDIDRSRGDLWAASVQETVGSAGGLHRMQLISGRPLQTIAPPAEHQPWHPVALLVVGAAVVTADDEGRVWMTGAGGAALRRVATVPARGTLAMTAVPGRDDTVLVASTTQVFAVALDTGRVTEVTVSVEGALTGIEQIAVWHDRVVVIQQTPEGARHLAHWRPMNRGRQATAVVRLSPALEAGVLAPMLTVVGDEAWLTARPADGSGGAAALRVLRVRLR